MDEIDQLFNIRPLSQDDRNWVAHFLDEHWSSTKVVTRGKSVYAHLLPGFVAELADAPDDAPAIGLVTYNLEGDNCEIMTLNSLQPGIGVGTALLEAIKMAAEEAGLRRLWLIITNDNMHALRFLQKRGFHLAAVYPQSLTESRKMKPQIPLVGQDGIPLRDEIELELIL